MQIKLLWYVAVGLFGLGTPIWTYPVWAQVPVPVAPYACKGGATVITTGGTAVTVIIGPINGGFVYNPVNAAQQGIGSAESLYVDMVSTPGSTDAAANGTTAGLAPGQNFPIPPLSVGALVKGNAATSGHKLTAECW